MSFTFKKEERLCSFSLIDKLFAEGKSFVKYPFRVVYLQLPDDANQPAQVMMSVAKKRFKRANKRNLIRRKMKEAYRQQKHLLYESLNDNNKKIAFAVMYLPTEILTYTEIEKGINKVIAHFSNIKWSDNKNAKQS